MAKKGFTPGRGASGADSLEDHLEVKSWRNWVLSVVVFLLTAIGLASIVLILLNAREVASWPWSHSEPALTMVLLLVSLLFTGYLTHQQRRVRGLLSESHRSRTQQMSELRLHHDRLAAFLDLMRTMGTEIDSQTVYDKITEICHSTFTCDQVSLMLLNQKTQMLEVKSALGHPPGQTEIVGIQQDVGAGIAGRLAQNPRPVILGPEIDKEEYGDHQPRSYVTSAAMIVPVLLRDELIGLVNVSSRDPAVRYVQKDLDALRLFAETSSVYCRFAEQSEWMRHVIRNLDSALQTGKTEREAA